MRNYDNTPGRNTDSFMERLADVVFLLLVTGGAVAVVFFGLLAFLSES
jgi:hypothetical protein